MNYTISNDFICLTVSSNACEMHSLQKTNVDFEYLWNGDAKYWAGRNPILFPFVSSTNNKELIFKDKVHSINNHGFARNQEFSLISKTNDSLRFQLKDNDETHRMYPYHFELNVVYTLNENKVQINYEIINKDEEEMPFSFGLHPAFNCNYHDEFKILEINDEYEIIIDDGLFEKHPTLMIEDSNIKSCVLEDVNHPIRLDFQGYNIFAIWSKPGAKFVCLEPWYSKIDSDDVSTPFKDREGVIKLQPNEKYYFSLNISI